MSDTTQNIQYTQNSTNLPGPAVSNNHKKLLLGSIVAGIIVVAAVILYITIFYQITPRETNVKTYTDTLHYIGINVPSNWVTDQEDGSNTVGLNTDHPVSQHVEISQLYIPQEGITIQVYEGIPTCPLSPPVTTTFAGFPAAYDPVFNSWTIPTTKATVIITISYPGSNGIVNSQNITPVPSVVADQNKQYIMAVLKTMKLTNLTSFSCK